MTQKKKQPKKQQINVQLSKDDLKELFTVIKDFLTEELFADYKVAVCHQIDCHNQRIIELERAERHQKIRRISFCTHDYRIKSIQYFETSHSLEVVTYKCVQCELEWRKLPCFLTRKEKKALKKLGVKI